MSPLDALDLLLRVHASEPPSRAATRATGRGRRCRARPRARASPSSPPRGTSGRGRRGSRRRRARRARARATRGSRRRGGWSARRGGAGRGRRRARGRARRASARRPRTCAAAGRGPRPRSRGRAGPRSARSRQRVAARVLEPRLRLGVAVERRLVVVALGHRLLEPPELVLERDEVARAGEHVLAQASAPARAAAAGRAARRASPSANASSPPCFSVSPARIRSSVVLPAPFGPESATRSRRSTENETPSKRTVPASSLRRLDAMTTAMAAPG